MHPTEGSGEFWITPNGDSSPVRASPHPQPARYQHQPPYDTSSELSGTGAWADSNVDTRDTRHPTEIQLSPSLSPAQVRPQLRCDTQQTTPTITFPEDHRTTTSEAEPLIAYNSGFDSPHRSTASNGASTIDSSSLPHRDIDLDTADDDQVFFSAQASPIYEQSNPSSPIEPNPYTGRPGSNSLCSVSCRYSGSPDEEESIKHSRSHLGIPGSSPILLPETGPPAIPRDPSVISDAGLQQQYQQEQKRTRKRTASTFTSSPVERYPTSLSDSEPWALQKKILGETKRTAKALNPSAPSFLPKGQLQLLINQQSVYNELRQHLPGNYKDEKIGRRARRIWSTENVLIKGKEKIKSFRKIFAILVLLDMVPSITHLMKENVSDLDLPLVPVLDGQTIVGLKRQSDAASDTPSLPCFVGRWSYSKLHAFDKYQWMMLAPFFSHGEDGETKHYILQDDHILPFIDYYKAIESWGGFAKVMMVDIHRDHYNFQDAEQHKGGFAIKQLYAEDHEAFDRERYILKRFCGPQRHPHVVSLLATYEQHNKFHLIFYRAEGDLLRLWNEAVPKPEITQDNVLWMAAQCTGIADGLMHLHKHLTFLRREREIIMGIPSTPDQPFTLEQSHESVFMRTDTMQSSGARVPLDSPTWKHRHEDTYLIETDAEPVIERFGRHGDIDPGNILWFAGKSPQIKNLQGTLKLADFGQARLNSKQSKTTQSSVANKVTYRPPECEIEPIHIGQSYDIWCLGCVYLEFATWVLGGAELLHRFATQRRTSNFRRPDLISDEFFEFFQADMRNYVRVKPAVTKFINSLHHHKNCTDFIHELLNLVQHDMILVDSTQRKPCDQVKKILNDLYIKCINQEGYACQRNPWVNGNHLTYAGQPYPLRIEGHSLLGRPNTLERRPSGLPLQIHTRYSN